MTPNLTPAQLLTLKAAIIADATLNAKPMNGDGYFDIAVAMNVPATPAFKVWKTSVATDEIMRNGFDWTRVDNLTVGKARIMEWMMNTGIINPSQTNVRAGVEACFSVEVADGPNRQAIYDHSVRDATRAEKLFATGTGAVPTNHGVGPATMVASGLLTASEVEAARNAV